MLPPRAAPTVSPGVLLPEVLDALDRGALILAPTALAAANLRASFDHRQRAAGRMIWQPANVLSWQQWLGSLWTSLILNGHETRVLLNPAQEELLWRDIVAPSLDAANQASASGFAAMARSAFALAASYNITARLASFSQTEDTEQFARWATEFTRTCGRHEYLPSARLPAALVEHIRRQALTLPAELHLVHFLEVSPADADLLEALRRAGVHIIEHTPPAAAPATRLTLCAVGETEELRAAAHWIRRLLEDFQAQHPTLTGPADLPPVHVVLADPNPDLAALDSIFREVLAPELNLLSADPSSAPWEIAAGRPLASQPVVATLVRLLRGLIRPLALDDITALLLSPHLGPAHDRETAAQFDVSALRDRPPLRPEMTFRELQLLAQKSAFGQGTLAWLTPLLGAVRATGDLDAARTYAAWTTVVRDLAAAAGWPGAHPLGPAEFAVTQAWEHVLDSVAALDFTGRRIPFSEALAALEHQLAAATFALPTHAPVRILTIAEAAVTPADVLVLLQATDTNWPPEVRPHPLLPWALQASAGMPGAHPVRDAARAQTLTDALFGPTPHVLLTYATEAGEAPQRLAPALARLHSAPLWREQPAADVIPALPPPVIPERVIDSVPLPPLPSPHVPGGAKVLQLQAACGFRAFAEIRLRSTEPLYPALGIDAGRAGSLLHHALDLFWQRVPSQSALLALPDEKLDEHLAEAIQRAFDRDPSLARDAIPRDADPWDKAYRALQMHRLFDLLKDWLAYECSRAPFTVLGREQERDLTVGPLELKLRVDRIDSVDDGAGTVLIDYKTGYDARPSAWESDRPDQPQLPLYTLLPSAAELRGLAFARIRAAQFTWAGIQTEPGLLGKSRLEPDLGQLVHQWREVLTRLAEQFAAGDHSVNPKSFPTTCAHCGQRSLCRLDPRTLRAASLEEESDASEVEATTNG